MLHSEWVILTTDYSKYIHRMQWNCLAPAFLISDLDRFFSVGSHGLGQLLFRNRYFVADRAEDEGVYRFLGRFGQQSGSGCAAPKRCIHRRTNTGNTFCIFFRTLDLETKVPVKTNRAQHLVSTRFWETKLVAIPMNRYWETLWNSTPI